MRLLDFLQARPEARPVMELLISQLTPSSQQFLRRVLAGEVHGLRGEERVRLHRIERQFWILYYAWWARKQARLPLEIELFALEEMERAGLTSAVERRLSELRRGYEGEAFAHLRLTRFQYQYVVRQGKVLRHIRRGLAEMQRAVKHISRHLSWQRVQISLLRLMQRGGKYSPAGAAALERLRALSLWQKRASSQEELPMRRHCEGLLHLLMGQWEASAERFETLIAEYGPQTATGLAARLNRWLVGLYQGDPPHTLLRLIDSLMEAESLPEVDKSTLLHHLLRTIWLYGTPDLMRQYYAVLRRHCVGRPHSGELQVALAAIARGAGLMDDAFIHYKRAQLPRFTLPTRLEAYLGAFLITIEKNTLASEFKSTYKFLLRYRDRLPDAELFIQLLRIIAQAHTPYTRYYTLWQEWQTLLKRYPGERFVWQITPIPLWSQCLIQRKSLENELGGRPVHHDLPPAIDKLINRHFP